MSHAESRAAEVWNRFAGLFGGDSLARKYGDTPPDEWVGVLGSLNPFQLDRGMRRLVYSGSKHVPTLPEFMRLCRTIGSDEEFGGQRSQPALPAPDEFPGDEWDAAAGRHLLAHTIKNPIREGAATLGALRMRDEELVKHEIDRNSLNASPKFIARVKKRIAAKNAWAADMRDLAANNGGEVPVELQKSIWSDYITKAEA